MEKGCEPVVRPTPEGSERPCRDDPAEQSRPARSGLVRCRHHAALLARIAVTSASTVARSASEVPTRAARSRASAICAWSPLLIAQAKTSAAAVWASKLRPANAASISAPVRPAWRAPRSSAASVLSQPQSARTASRSCARTRRENRSGFTIRRSSGSAKSACQVRPKPGLDVVSSDVIATHDLCSCYASVTGSQEIDHHGSCDNRPTGKWIVPENETSRQLMKRLARSLLTAKSTKALTLADALRPSGCTT